MEGYFDQDLACLLADVNCKLSKISSMWSDSLSQKKTKYETEIVPILRT